MPSTPNQKTIAEELGISISAVSLALRGSPKVGAEMRQKVLEKAAKLGYQFNSHARNLVGHRRFARPDRLPLALLNIWREPADLMKRPTWETMRSACVRRAEQLGYYIEEFFPRAHGMSAKRVNHILKSRGIRGVIVGPPPVPASHLRFEWNSYASVALGFGLRRPDLNRVCVNLGRAIQLALHHLKNAGYTRPGLAIGSFANESGWDGSLTGAWLHYHYGSKARDQVPVHEYWMRKQSERINNPKGFLQWIKKYQPDVVIARWEGLLEWMREAGYSVPGEIGFVHLSLYEGLRESIGEELTGYFRTENQ